MSTLDGSPLFGSADDADGRSSTLRQFAVRSLATGVERIAFWTAIVLPFLYAPLLFNGVTTNGERAALGILIALNGVALYLGNGYEPS